MGEIDEGRLKKETATLKQLLAKVERPEEVLDVERAVNSLRDVGTLWVESPRELQRESVQEAFGRIVVESSQVASITPKPLYPPLFALDRIERFDAEMGVVWRPRQDSNLQPTA